MTERLRELASDPDTPLDVLADLAYRHPELRGLIAQNPSTYPALRQWIAEAERATDTGGDAENSPSTVTIANPSGSTRPVGVLIGVIGLAALATIVVGALIAQYLVGLAAVPGSSTPGPNADGTSSVDPESGAGSEGGAIGEASGSGGVPATVEPHYVPTVLILDASGSMVRSVPSGGTRMQAARAAAATFISGLADGAEVGLTVFGTSTGNSDAERAAGCHDVRTLVPVGPVNEQAFLSAVGSVSESGFTPLGPALQSAAAQLAGHPRAQIVLVSDGVETCSPPACGIAAQLHGDNPGLSINVVGFAVDADEQAQVQLECVAAAGGGEYVDASNAEQLAARLRLLSDPVSTANSLNPRGFEGLRLGMSLDQVRAADPSLVVGDITLEIVFAECDDATLEFRHGRLFAITPKASVATAENVTAGEDVARAMAIYGAPLRTGSDAEGAFAEFPASPGSDSGYRVYYEQAASGSLSGKILRIVVCLCGTGGGIVSEISAWQLGLEGLGPLTWNMRYDDVLSVSPRSLAPNECGVFALDRTGAGRSVVLFLRGDFEQSTLLAIQIAGGVGGSPSVLPRTAMGIGIGSTRGEVLEAYPAATIVHDSEEGVLVTYTDHRGHAMVFSLNSQDTVSGVQVGTTSTPVRTPCRAHGLNE